MIRPWLFAGLMISSSPIVHADPLDQVLATIASGETGNDPDAHSALYGGGHFKRFGFPEWSGKIGPEGISHAAGKCQFQPGTWVKAAQAFIAAGNPIPDFNNAENQDAVCKFWAASVYQKNTGRSLAVDAEIGRVEWKALAGEWTSLRSKSAAPKPSTRMAAKAVDAPIQPKSGTSEQTEASPNWNVFGGAGGGFSFVITSTR